MEEDQVKAIVAAVTEIVTHIGVAAEQVKLESAFVEDLGADSLDTVEMVMAAEEKFGIEISDEDAEKLRTVGDAVEYLKARNVAVN